MLKYICLGIIQGLTEFLPVSSSGHLVIMQKVLGVGQDEVALSVIVHLGTVLALVIFFFKDILAALRSPKTIGLIIMVTVITGIIGISGRDFFERLFTLPRLVALMLIITAIILLFTKKFMEGKRKNIGFRDALILGLTQGLAIIPGISRSGITISTLLFRGIDRQTSFKFSFLASIPAILGAALLEMNKVSLALKADLINLSSGFIASLITGILSLWILRLVMRKAKLYYFGYYCIIVAVIVLLLIR